MGSASLKKGGQRGSSHVSTPQLRRGSCINLSEGRDGTAPLLRQTSMLAPNKTGDASRDRFNNKRALCPSAHAIP